MTHDDTRKGHQETLVPTNPYATMPDDLREAFACLYLAPNAPLCVAEGSHRALSRVFHPDRRDGDISIIERLDNAIATVKRYLVSSDEDDDIPF